jgi:DNA-binding transcriptional LysR family regulator
MPRPEVNRAAELEAFVAVAERAGFSAAARHLGVTPSAMSKLVARLEARLGARLLQRSTRRLELTDEGRRLHDHAVRVLADLDEAERSVAAAGTPTGRVSINASIPFGHHVLVPLLPRLVAELPGLTIDLTLTDRVIDLIEERTDIAVRWGPLTSSDLVARRLGETDQLIVGAPAYLSRRGVPRTADDLRRHDRLGTNYRRARPDWPLRTRAGLVEVPISGPLRVGDGETLRLLALAGAGLARLSRYHIQHDLDRGALVPVLESLNPGDVAPIHAVYVGKPGNLPARVRAVLDFLQAHASIAAAPGRAGRRRS